MSGFGGNSLQQGFWYIGMGNTSGDRTLSIEPDANGYLRWYQGDSPRLPLAENTHLINHKGSDVGTAVDNGWHLYTFTFETVDAKIYYKFYLDGVKLFTLNLTDYSSSDHFDARLAHFGLEIIDSINIGRNLVIGNWNFYLWKFFMSDSVLTDQDIQLYYNQRVNNT
jgi:hypothetical protein